MELHFQIFGSVAALTYNTVPLETEWRFPFPINLVLIFVRIAIRIINPIRIEVRTINTIIIVIRIINPKIVVIRIINPKK